MKTVIRLQVIFLLLSCWQSVAAQSIVRGKVVESIKLRSKILGQEVNYCIYLPSDYEASYRRYPVVYLLHGYTDDETGWIQFGEANLIADKAIAAQEAPPMIIVMPDAGVTWYVNDYKDKKKYEDMFVNELIPHIDATYRTRAKREYRGVAGLSMGGYGSLLYAMHHPDLFGSCAAFSSAIYTDSTMRTMPIDRYNTVFADLYSGPVTGKERLTSTWNKNSVLNLARTLPEEALKKVSWYIDCGDDDFLYEGNMLLHITLRNRAIPHEFRVRDGAHEWKYWRTGLPEALKFIGQTFHR